MHRFAIASATLALLGLGPTASSATPMDHTAAAQRAPVLTLIGGWWEQENRTDAPDRYWHLNLADRKRYNEAQARIERRHKRYHLNDYDRRDDRDLTEQRKLLDY
jgi:hypothetical protein